MEEHEASDEGVPRRPVDRWQEPAGTNGAGHDRQVLVVGSGFVPALCAGFLEQAGLGPVLAPRGKPRTANPSTVVTIWRPGLTLLERLGLRRPVELLGTPLGRLERPQTDTSWTGTHTDGPWLVAIRASRLEALLDRQLLHRLRTVDRSVSWIEPTDAGVRVQFEGGIDEPFDAVVSATPISRSPFERETCSSTIHTVAFEWPGASTPRVPIEAWTTDVAAIATPVADGTEGLLVATDVPTDRPGDVDALEGRFADLFGESRAPFAALDDAGVRYRRTAVRAPASVHTGPVGRIGMHAHATVPGDGLGATLGIEDAWVIADALSYGPSEVEAALASFEDRRRRRVAAIESTVRADNAGDRIAPDLDPRLQRVRANRSLAFGHVLEDEPSSVARVQPRSL